MSTSKQLNGAATHDLTWKLNCGVWASVDQQDRKKAYAKADSDTMKDQSLQVISLAWAQEKICMRGDTYTWSHFMR
jgi:hypothetical protein